MMNASDWKTLFSVIASTSFSRAGNRHDFGG